MSLYVFSSIAIKYDPNPPEKKLKINQSINQILHRFRESVTAKGEAVARDDASLNHRVLLLGERLNRESKLRQETGPRFDEEEPEQTGGDVQRRDDAYSEIQLVSDDAEQRPQQRAND